MRLTRYWLLVICTCIVAAAADDAIVSREDSGSQDTMEDFPLDDTREDHSSVNADPEERGVVEETEDGAQSSILNSLEDQHELFTTEEGKQELLKKVMIAAMSRPGARQRLAQVMPILRTMSSAQRLALATLVTSQLMAPPGATPPPLNTTKNNLTEELMLPISMDIAAMFRGLGREAASARSALHRGSEIIRARYPPYRRRPILTSQNNNRRTTNVAVEMKPPPPPLYPRLTPPRVKLPPSKLLLNRFPPSATRDQPTDERQQLGIDCEYFTHSVCLEVSNYPTDDIMESINNTPNKASLEALISDSKQDIRDIVPEEDNSMERRQGDVSLSAEDNGHMCSSKVQVARPKRARTTSGQWKYIVNTGDYTQTLRLEMCLKPQQTCSFLSENYKSQCTQIYNYHRLLTWDQKSGLTMDIFKVPTCCSCHVQGYSYAFTPGEPIQGPRNPLPPPISASNTIPQPPVPPPRESGPYIERPETNFVRDDIPMLHRLPPPAKYLTRVRPSSQIPKREGVTKRPAVQHRGPPLPLHHERDTILNFRYPPYDNMVRRTTTRNNSSQDEIVNSVRPFFPVRPTPNQRHPELPVDNIISETELAAVTVEAYTTPATIISTTTQHTTPPPSKRINYSYHPIIDFFKTGVSAVAFEDRIDNDDWTPITDGPRVIPK